MFQSARGAQEWLKGLGYPLLEPLVFSAPPLPKSAAKHIQEWALLAKLEDGLGLPIHIYWLHATLGSKLPDLKYVVHVYSRRYPNIRPLVVARYKPRGRVQWRCVLMCPNYEAPQGHWGKTLYKVISPDTEPSTLLRYDPTVPLEKHWQRIYATLRGEPMNERVKQVLESCIAELENILVEMNTEIKRALDEGNYAQSQRLIQEAESVKQVIEQIGHIKDRSPSGPTTTLARPPVSRTSKRMRATGVTSQKAYQIPLLEALVELGGRASVSKVLERVYEKVKHSLTPKDLETLPSGGDIRWRNAVMWVRSKLKDQGLLAADSPKGIWEITEAGRRYLEAMKQAHSSP
jgi:hypothetical protein